MVKQTHSSKIKWSRLAACYHNDSTTSCVTLGDLASSSSYVDVTEQGRASNGAKGNTSMVDDARAAYLHSPPPFVPDPPPGSAQEEEEIEMQETEVLTANGGRDPNSITYKLSELTRIPQIDLKLRGREVVLAIFTFLFFCLFVGVILAWRTVDPRMMCLDDDDDKKHPAPQPAPVPDFCTTPACVKYAALLVDNMDPSVNPCEDFWSFACGGWAERVKVPQGRDSWSIDDELAAKVEFQIKKLLEGPIEKNTQFSAERKVKQYYLSCMDVDAVEKAGKAPLVDIINSLGGWDVLGNWNIGPNSGQWDFNRVLRKLHFDYWTDAFFTFFVAIDEQNPGKHILQISPSGLGLPSRSYIYDDHNIRAYRDYMHTIANIFHKDRRKAERFANDVLLVETALANITVGAETSFQANANISSSSFTLQDLQRIAPRVDWFQFFQHHFQNITPSTPIVVSSKEYIKKVSDLIDFYSFQRDNDRVRAISSYFIWKLISNYALDFSREFREAASTFSYITQGVSIKTQERYQLCIDRISRWMGMAVGALYTKAHFTEETHLKVENLAKSVKDAFKSHLKDISWISKETVEIARKKADALEYNMGHPKGLRTDIFINNYYSAMNATKSNSYFQNIMQAAQNDIHTQSKKLYQPVNKNEWSLYPQHINAVYSTSKNNLVLPAAIPQWPKYSFQLPAAINYGGVGIIIGHEISHGFSGRGAEYDEKGLLRNWWSPSSKTAYTKKVNCVANIYAKYLPPEKKIFANFTIDEDVADIGGVQTAYQAYQSWRASHGKEKSLPGFDYSGEQLFFLSFAQNFCTVRRHGVDSPSHDAIHTQDEIRVNATLSQIPQFAAAFKCPRKSPMNPSNRCRVWS